MKRFRGALFVITILFTAGSCSRSGNDHMAEGHSKLKGHDYKGAIEEFTKAIEMNPTSAPAYHNRGYAKKLMGAYTDAIEDYTKAIELEPNDGGHFAGRGGAYGLAGDKEKACADLRKGKELGYAKGEEEIQKYCN